ncbi:MAG: TetR/AcrR family transcriptional regulator [Flammeovirgaceae bacterium]
MPIKKITKEEIVMKSLEVFAQKGYHQTSMSDLAEACGLLKGSFYHHFESKEELMQEVLLNVRKYFREKIFSIAFDESILPKERLAKIAQKQLKIVSKNTIGCFVGNTTLETVQLHPNFKTHLQGFFTEWAEALAHIYESKYQTDYAFQLAWQTIMEVEGAMMMMKLWNDIKILEKTLERILDRF